MPVKESIGVGPVHLVGILKPPKSSHQGGIHRYHRLLCL